MLLSLTQSSFPYSGASAQLHVSIFTYIHINIYIYMDCGMGQLKVFATKLSPGWHLGLATSWKEGKCRERNCMMWGVWWTQHHQCVWKEKLMTHLNFLWGVGAMMELCVEEDTAGQHHGTSARGKTERPQHPYLCFSWLCKHYFFLSSTATKNSLALH